jgi:hypothetical protein
VIKECRLSTVLEKGTKGGEQRRIGPSHDLPDNMRSQAMTRT